MPRLASSDDAQSNELKRQQSSICLANFLSPGQTLDDPLMEESLLMEAESELRPLPPLEDEQTYLLDADKLFSTELTDSPDSPTSQQFNLFQSVVSDHAQFYSRDSLGLLALGLGAGAALANTNADDFISRDFYQENVRNASTDEYFEAIHGMKVFGEGRYALPIYTLAAGGGWVFSETDALTPPAEWGKRSLRSVLVGGPPMLMLQWIVGGSRPGEAHSGSHWEPFQDNNGVSGHSFMGAIPFLNAANMTDEPWLRAAYYVGSGMAGLSRVNDDSHYTSQAVLGWWVAYLAARSVHHTEIGATFTPLVKLSPAGDSLLGIEYRW